MSIEKEYRRVMLGKGNMYAEEALKGNFIAAGFIFDIDLTDRFSDDWRDFNKEWIPVFLEQNPEKSKVAAGLACGMLYTGSKGLKKGDVVNELAEEDQSVRGVIIALEDDLRLKRALSVAPNIDFYRYRVSFQLIAGAN